MLSTGSKITVRAALFAWSMTSALTGCSSNSTTAPAAPVAAKIVNMTGAAQLVANVALAIPGGASVQVQDANGLPISGAIVTWTAFDGGSVSTATSTTDAKGMAVVDWTFGTVAGADSLRASTGTNISTWIVGTAQAGSVAQLIEVTGDQQVLGEGASTQLAVKAVDQYGNVVPNYPVIWLDQGGGALSGTSTVTDANGVAQVILTTDLAPEQYVIVAQAATATVTFVDVSN
jgi:adhesin/invasin